MKSTWFGLLAAISLFSAQPAAAISFTPEDLSSGAFAANGDAQGQQGSDSQGQDEQSRATPSDPIVNVPGPLVGTPSAVPGPIVGTGLPSLVLVGIGLIALARRRKIA